MSGYENVARQLETVAKIRAAANAGSKLRNKQRKWKIYLSICLLLPALAAIIGIVAWAISIEVASTNSIHISGSNSNSHKGFHHKNQQHSHEKTPQSLVFHPFRRHQPPPELVENSPLGPKGIELSDTRGSKPVAAAVISSFAKLRNFATDNRSSVVANSFATKETITSDANRSQPSANIIQNGANTGQNKNQKRSDSGWSENNSESVNSGNNSKDDVESDDDNNRASSSSSIISQTELIKPSVDNEQVQVPERSKDGISSTTTTSTTLAPSTTTKTTTTTTTTTTTQAPKKSSIALKPDDTGISTSETSQNGGSSNQQDEDESPSLISASSSPMMKGKTRLDLKSEHNNRADDRMMMMMAAAIMPGEYSQKAHQKRPWFDGYTNERNALRVNSNRESSELRKSWSHGQFKPQIQPSHSQSNQDNLDKNGDCEQQKVVEEQEDGNNQHQAQQPTALAAAAAAADDDGDGDEKIAIKTPGGLKQNSRYNIIQDKTSDALSESSSLSTSTTASSAITTSPSDEDSNDEREKQTSFDNGQSSISNENNPESESVSSKQEVADSNDETPASLFYAANDQHKSFEDKSISSRDNNEQNDEISFEAIANAISSTLSANSDNDSTAAETTATNHSDGNGKSIDLDASTDSGSIQPEVDNKHSKLSRSRQRTTGEHLAEVIDHIVERRKQAQTNHAAIQRGPQIVVVAPIEDGMRARSLTKVSPSETDGSAGQAAAVIGEPKKKSVDDKRSVSSMKKEAHLQASSGSTSKIKQLVGNSKSKKSTRIIGARLLGTGLINSTSASGNVDSEEQQPIKYSERVEVIEDDDSSPLLIKNIPDQSKLESEDSDRDRDFSRMDEEIHENPRESDESLLLPHDYQSSIHVSSQPGEARFRSARHELNPNQVFERYARLQQREGEGEKSSLNQASSSSSNVQARLYSAEQLIRDHVLKSKLQPNKQKKAQQVINSGDGGNGEEQNTKTLRQNQPERLDNNRLSTSYTLAQPINNNIENQPKQASNQYQNLQQQVKARPTTTKPQSSSMQSISSATEASISPEQTAMTSTSTESSNLNRQQTLESRRQQASIHDNVEINQAIASNIQSVQVPLFLQNQRINQQNREEMHSRPENEIFQAKESQPQIVNYQEQQQQISLPMFADQEYNVPAHMAESVIHDIQQTSATMSMVNGQPTIVNVPARQAFFSQNANNQLMSPEASNLNHQQQMMMYHGMPPQQPQFQHQVYPNQQQKYPMPDSWNRYQDIQRQQQRQVLANRNGFETQQATPVSISVKTPKGLINPVAQVALRHLFNSFKDRSPLQRGQSEPLSAAPSPPQSSNQASPDQESRSIPLVRATQSAISPPSTLNNQQIHEQYNIADPMQVEAASLSSMRVPAAPTVDPSTGRQMRSLPIGAAASSVIPQQQQQQQLLTSSQDLSTAESYSNMPNYYMGGGGEGGHHYGGNNYESEHDKKSKGITFHFGGGPIGGGTQLITSPMGIFKHLMIPLLPNPRVNLNGKVVFGVVLEKSTAIGPPTKKKYKFWGK